RRINLERVARVVTVHGVWRDEDGAVDADFVHRLDHIVARHLRRSVENRRPGAAGVVALVSMHLGIDDLHGPLPFSDFSLRWPQRSPTPQLGSSPSAPTSSAPAALPSRTASAPAPIPRRACRRSGMRRSARSRPRPSGAPRAGGGSCPACPSSPPS